jgi:BirA family biotin operon repressor/biotin-[acetyl-CoA-carboxylase] ligase
VTVDSTVREWEGQPVALWESVWAVPRLEIHARLGSTNDRARALAEDGWGVYTTVIADEQTEGRGRSGARWHSAAGAGLWISVLLPAAPAPHLPLLVGLAAAEAIERTCPGLRPRIEWPNDVTLGDRKVAGVLCEGVGSHVVAGVGINLRMPPGGFPSDIEARATALDREGVRDPDRAALAGALIAAFRGKLAAAGPRLSHEERMAISERDALEGRQVVTAQHGPGRAMGVADDGALVLERAGGHTVHVRAGRVRPASS